MGTTINKATQTHFNWNTTTQPILTKPWFDSSPPWQCLTSHQTAWTTDNSHPQNECASQTSYRPQIVIHTMNVPLPHTTDQTANHKMNVPLPHPTDQTAIHKMNMPLPHPTDHRQPSTKWTCLSDILQTTVSHPHNERASPTYYGPDSQPQNERASPTSYRPQTANHKMNVPLPHPTDHRQPSTKWTCLSHILLNTRIWNTLWLFVTSL